MDGVSASGGIFSLYENLRLYKNGSPGFGIGLLVGGGSIVRGCVWSYNVGNGFNSATFIGGGETTAGVVVEDCTAQGNDGIGFQLQRAVITNCRAYNNSLGGITCIDGASVVSAPNSIMISGATGGAGVGTSEPWANISF